MCNSCITIWKRVGGDSAPPEYVYLLMGVLFHEEVALAPMRQETRRALGLPKDGYVGEIEIVRRIVTAGPVLLERVQVALALRGEVGA